MTLESLFIYFFKQEGRRFIRRVKRSLTSCVQVSALQREDRQQERKTNLKDKMSCNAVTDGTWNNTHVFATQFFSCLNLEPSASLVLLLLSAASVCSC